MAKGLSRMKGNFHVRFLGGWRVATPPGYPVVRQGAATVGARCRAHGGPDARRRSRAENA
jgi:hypothetical protein